MIKIVNGNILDAKEDVIAHQVNCKKVMGGGLALQIKNKYPEVYSEYLSFFDIYGKQLGRCQMVLCKDGKTIANLFGQYDYGTLKQHTNYDYLKISLKSLLFNLKRHNLSVAIPYNMGCGLGGGDWNTVYKIIEEVFEGYNVTIYKL